MCRVWETINIEEKGIMYSSKLCTDFVYRLDYSTPRINSRNLGGKRLVQVEQERD